jgi:alpha-glucan,water dikinase
MSSSISSIIKDDDPNLDTIEKEVYDLPLDETAKIQVTLIRTIKKDKLNINPIKYLINLILDLQNTSDNIQLHWAVYKKNNASLWLHPNEKFYPKNTVDADKCSVDTSFEKNKIEFDFEITSDDENIFQGLNFVLKNLSNGVWYNNHGQNYRIEIIPREKTVYNEQNEKELIIPECIKDAVDLEGNAGNWSLMHRYQKVRDCLFLLDLENPKESLWIYIWLKYSFRRILTWQRQFNTPPKDLQWSMHCLTFELTKRFSELCSQSQKNEKIEKNKKFFLSSKMIIKDSCVLIGKGRENGQRIRDEILNIFHKFHISEKIDSFYEQWHQKLHNNTTPDDIIICQALVNFLRTNNMNEFWNTLNYGGVNKQRLESFERKITMEPYYEPAYLHDFENFLNLLKEVHGSADLVLMFDQSKYAFGNNHQIFNEIIYFKDDWDTLKQIWRVTNGREILKNLIENALNDHGKLRDLLFFDDALQLYLRQIIEKILHINLEFNNYISIITALLKNLNLYFDNFPEIEICLKDWLSFGENLKNDVNQGNKDSAMKIKSITDRIGRLLGHVIDYYNTIFAPRASYFGKECKVDEKIVDIFTEEEIRGSIFFALSMILKKIEPILRNKANLGPWLIISRGQSENICGKVRYEKELKTVQLENFKEKTILFTENVGGSEEIPNNCNAVVILNPNNYPDMLAHVSVRARNLKVALVVCFEQNMYQELKNNNDKFLEIKFNGNNIEYKNINSLEEKNEENNAEENNINNNKNIKPTKIDNEFNKPYIEIDEFENDKVGAKSNNLKKIYKKLPSWIKYPESFSIPFNVFEYFINLPQNSEEKENLSNLISQLDSLEENEFNKSSELLNNCASIIINQLDLPEDDEYFIQLKSRLEKFGINENELPEAIKSIKRVWASKFNERAFISCRKIGIKLDEISMAVLCQKIIEAEYAFVIHTKNPSNNNKNEIYCEAVYGMGESLVGAYEGQSFSFIYNKETKNINIMTYPNKSIALKNKGYIFRSDSNTEDLEGFAGAGLFDSIPMVEYEEVDMEYGINKIFSDGNWRGELMNGIANLGMEIEKIFDGEPQDIEGVYYNKEFYIVQTRPQV